MVEPVMRALADRVGISVGQSYTLATGFVIAVVLGAIGLPPVLDSAGRTSPAPGRLPSDGDSAAAAPASASPSGGATVPRATAAAPFVPATPSPHAPAAVTIPGVTPPPATIPVSPPGSTRVLARVPDPGAPEGIAVAPDGVVYVATNNADGRGGSGDSRIFAFDSGGSAIGSWVLTGQPEERALGLTGLTVDAAGLVWVLDAATARVIRLDPRTSGLTVVARIPDVGLCLLPFEATCEPGLVDNPPEPRDLAFDRDGLLFVTDRTQGIVWKVGADGDVGVFATIDDRMPGEGPWGLAVTDDGSLVVTVTGSLATVPPGGGQIMRIEIGDDGATRAVEVEQFESEVGLAGIAVGSRGRLYVALSGDDAVLGLDPDGTRQHFDGGSVSPGFDTPTGLALRSGSVLVTNQSAIGNEPDHWVVHDITVDDSPLGT